VSTARTDGRTDGRTGEHCAREASAGAHALPVGGKRRLPHPLAHYQIARLCLPSPRFKHCRPQKAHRLPRLLPALQVRTGGTPGCGIRISGRHLRSLLLLLLPPIPLLDEAEVGSCVGHFPVQATGGSLTLVLRHRQPMPALWPRGQVRRLPHGGRLLQVRGSHGAHRHLQQTWEGLKLQLVEGGGRGLGVSQQGHLGVSGHRVHQLEVRRLPVRKLVVLEQALA
jgi:hypothetical protein